MSAAALLAKHPKPTDQEIDTGMNGNLCRCGTYVRVREAIHRAAGNARETHPWLVSDILPANAETEKGGL